MKSPTERHAGSKADGGAGTESPRKNLCNWPWAVIVSVVGLVVAGIAYSLGDAYHNAYLGKFSVYNGAFPADHPTHFVLAVWGGLHATLALQNWLGGHVIKLLVASAVCLAYFAALPVVLAVISPFFANRKARVEGARALLAKHPLLRKYIGTVMVVVFFVISALWFFLFVPPAISIPSAIGEAVGEDVAKTDLKDFERGCDHSVTKCYQAVKDGKEIARGYVIAQSANRIALYYKGNTVQFPLGDVVLKTLDTAAKQDPKP
jgi:hypothetical protein